MKHYPHALATPVGTQGMRLMLNRFGSRLAGWAWRSPPTAGWAWRSPPSAGWAWRSPPTAGWAWRSPLIAGWAWRSPPTVRTRNLTRPVGRPV